MQDKMKFVFIGLAASVAILILLLLGVSQNVNRVSKERDSLKDSAATLNAQLANLNKENADMKEEFDAAERSLERVDAEKAEAERKFNSLVEERDNLKSAMALLNSRLSELQGRAERAVETKKVIETAVPPPEADAYWAGILKKKADLELRLDNLREELKVAKSESEQLKRQKDKLEQDLKNYDMDQKDANREFEYNKKLLDSVSAELAREKTDKFQLTQTLKELKNENKFLKQQLRIISDRKVKLEEKLAELQENNSVLEGNMAKMELFVRDKILQVDSLRNDLGIQVDSLKNDLGGIMPAKEPEDAAGRKAAIELAPIVVRPQEDNFSKAKVIKNAAIIAVNRDSNFAIINIGATLGVKVGDIFRIFRKDEPIALVEVIQVRENIAACDIKNENTPIIIGDTAR